MFSPAFRRPFQNAFANPDAVAIVPWYLAGGISAANCKAAYQPKGAASLAASYINLANPGTNNAAPGVAPTFNTSTGWTFNGTTQYLQTGIIPGVGAKSMLVQFSGLTATGEKVLAGARGSVTSQFFYIDLYFTGNQIYFDSTHFITGTITAGNLAIIGTAAYKNGVNQSLTLTNQDATLEIFIGALNNLTSVYAPLAGNVLAFAYYTINLTSGQVAAVAAAMAAL